MIPIPNETTVEFTFDDMSRFRELNAKADELEKCLGYKFDDWMRGLFDNDFEKKSEELGLDWNNMSSTECLCKLEEIRIMVLKDWIVTDVVVAKRKEWERERKEREWKSMSIWERLHEWLAL